MRIVFTGASGVLGQAVLPLLAGHHVTALARTRRPDGVADVVQGDLAAAHFGLGRSDFLRLAHRTDVIVHCGAVVSFGAEPELVEATNVGGTRTVVELARLAGARLVHVSTAYVGRRPGRPGAAASTTVTPDRYVASKQAGEEVVTSSGVPYTIVRPSIIVGDSLTGHIAQFQGLHEFAAGLLTGRFPFIPISPEAYVDFVPQDVSARVIRDAVESPVHDFGQDPARWVTAGASALSGQRLVDMIVAKADSAGFPIPPPRLVDPDAVDRLLRPAFFGLLPERDRRRFDNLLAMTSLFFTHDPLPSTIDISRQDVEDAWSVSLDHVIDARLAPSTTSRRPA